MAIEEDVTSGARSVEATQHAQSGLSSPEMAAESGLSDSAGLGQNPAATKLSGLVLSIFPQGQGVRVRVGSPVNSADLYEATFESAEDANFELLEAGILQSSQVKTMTEILGAGIGLADVSEEQLMRAGLKRLHSAGM